MPNYSVTDPKTGVTLKLTGDSPPTEQELEQIFSSYQVKQEPSFSDNAKGILEAGATMLSAPVAQVAGGLTGLAATLNPFQPEGAGAKISQDIQSQLTYSPGEEGQRVLNQIGELPVLKEIGEGFEKGSQYLGDQVYDITGSPTAAAIAKGIPEAAFTALGAKAPKATANNIEGLADAIPNRGEMSGGEFVKDTELKNAGDVLKTQDQNKIIDLIDSDPKFYKALEDLNITEQPLPSYASNNPQFRGIEQSFAAIPNSPQNAQALSFSKDVSNVADALAKKYDADDAAKLSMQWRDATMQTIDKLGEAGEDAYNSLNDVIDKRQAAKPTQTIKFIESATNDLPLGVDDPKVPSVIKTILNDLKPRYRSETKTVDTEYKNALGQSRMIPEEVTERVEIPANYEVLDQARKEVGAALFQKEGQFKDQQSGLLKKLYSTLSDDTLNMADSQGLQTQTQAAKNLTKQRKELESKTESLLGNKLQKDVIPVLKQRLTGLSSGSVENFKNVMSNLSKEEQPQYLYGAINDMFKQTLKGEADQFNATKFLQWYNQNLKKGAKRDLLSNYLTPDQVKTLDNYSEVAKGIARATSQKIPTGVVNSVLDDKAGFLARMIGKTARVAGRIPTMSRLTSDTLGGIGNVIANKNNARVQATQNLLADPKFQQLIQRSVASGVAQGNRQTKKAIELEKKIRKSNLYKQWADTLGDEKSALASMSLGQFLLGNRDYEEE